MKRTVFFLIAALIILVFFVAREQISIPQNLAWPQIPPADELSDKLIFLGDTGSGDENQKAVGQQIHDYCQKIPCEAVFVLGDVIYEEGVTSVTDPQFETKFETPYQDIPLPFYIAFGNHDYLGCRDCYLDYSKLSQRWKMPDYYYVQRIDDDLEIFVINTEEFTIQQEAWLWENIKNSTAVWKVVVGHRPLVSYEITKYSEHWDGEDRLRDVVCDEVDLYISGHAHVMEKNLVPDCSVLQVISGGGGATLRTFVPENESLFSAASHGFVSIAYTNQELWAEFVDISGKTIHEFNLTK